MPDKSSETGKRSSYRHLIRLGAVVFLIVGGAATARAFLIPKTFGQYGSYRGDAVKEAMVAKVPQHMGQAVCASCHPGVPKLHDKDVHRGVECESCHGPGVEHVGFFQKKGMFEPPKLFVPHTKEPCLWCHRRLAARPSGFPQIEPDAHYAFLGVTDKDTPCMKCHSPHEPLFLDRPVAEARLHPLIQQCQDCHEKAVEPAAERPDDHPQVFECSYCHADVAQDFETRSHKRLACSKCHLYQRESETAGRIVKNRADRFCLLCHEQQPFRGAALMPLIDPAAHDKGDSCLGCHREKIHGKGAEARAPMPDTGPDAEDADAGSAAEGADAGAAAEDGGAL